MVQIILAIKGCIVLRDLPCPNQLPPDQHPADFVGTRAYVEQLAESRQ